MAQIKMDRSCTFYISPNEQVMTNSEISKAFESGKSEDKIKVILKQYIEALKSLVIQIIHDDQIPRMVMNVINNLVPIQEESHSLKKILLFYWEVIEKTNPNGSLKDEMILVCNSLRKDLLHPNEYIRGRTLKLLSRIQLRGILEPLQTAIVENVNHKHVYVRRNAVVCLYEIFLNFGDDLISDMDEMMEKLLQTENDLSAKRNAFLLLFHINQQKALDYLNSNYAEDSAQFGDILQLSILELFRKVCKMDPAQKPKLLKSIYLFSKSKSPSVQYECANTLFAVSPSPASLKIAVQIYMSLITSQTDNNIKLVVLDRLEQIKNLNPKVLEDRSADLTVLLNQQSIDIRRKVLNLFQLKNENILLLSLAIQKEFQKCQNDNDVCLHEYRSLMLQVIGSMIGQFPQAHEVLVQIVIDCLLTSNKLDDASAQLANRIIQQLIQDQSLQLKLINACIIKFQDIQHIEIYKAVFVVLQDYCSDPVRAFEQIKKAIGELPLEQKKTTQIEEESQVQMKTIILPDGTYGTQIKQQELEQISKLRQLLLNNSFLSSSLSRMLMKLLEQIENDFNKYCSQVLLILCALLRYYQNNQNKVDQDTIEKITQCVKILTNPNVREILNKKYKQQQKKQIIQEKQQNELLNAENILKQPDDQIIIRQLKGLQEINEIDLADDETTVNVKIDENSYVQRLIHIVQLTGYADPIYSEAFVKVHKYDVQFEVLFVNRSTKMVQNVQVEFRTQGDSKTLERAQGVTLQPNQSARVKTSIKFSSSEIGVIYGAIHYENNAGIEQAYLVTKEISIDLIDFIYSGNIDLEQFRKSWTKYEWENRITINTNLINPAKYVKFIEKSLKMKQLSESNPQQSVVCANLYAKTKFDDDFLINISAEIIDNKLVGFVRIRSKVKGIVVSLGEKIKQLQSKIE